MQSRTTIARPYAQAIFETASEEKKLPEWSTMLRLLTMVATDLQMRAVLANPKWDAAASHDLFLSVCGQELSKTAKSLVKVLANAKRLSFLPQISALYEQLRSVAEGIVKISVISAYELLPDQQTKIAELMAERIGKRVQITDCTIDSSLIGGAIIHSGDTVIDGSLKGRLKKIADTMGNY